MGTCAVTAVGMRLEWGQFFLLVLHWCCGASVVTDAGTAGIQALGAASPQGKGQLTHCERGPYCGAKF